MYAPGSDQHNGSVSAEPREVVVIGGGQAGLAVGYFLAKQSRDFTILEAAGEPGAAWRARWDSLKLFTSARYSGLPGLDFPGDPDRYPLRDEVADYLSDYAERFELPVELSSPARSISKPDGRYLVTLDDRAYAADQVVVATGPFQVPFVPALAEGLDQDLAQLHSSDDRSPDAISEGPVLVVGGGNSGFQIAEELAAGHEVHMRWKLIDRQTGDENAAIDWRFRVGERAKIRLLNEMAGDHPMHHPFHVHGAGRFLVLARDGEVEPNLVWKDTVLVRAGETVDILLDVTNVGRWMAHCHIAEHHESGMMFSFDVAPAESGEESAR